MHAGRVLVSERNCILGHNYITCYRTLGATFYTPVSKKCMRGFFVSPELSSVRDYVITHSVRSMYLVCVCIYVFGILQN